MIESVSAERPFSLFGCSRRALSDKVVLAVMPFCRCGFWKIGRKRKRKASKSITELFGSVE